MPIVRWSGFVGTRKLIRTCCTECPPLYVNKTLHMQSGSIHSAANILSVQTPPCAKQVTSARARACRKQHCHMPFCFSWKRRYAPWGRKWIAFCGWQSLNRTPVCYQVHKDETGSIYWSVKQSSERDRECIATDKGPSAPRTAKDKVGHIQETFWGGPSASLFAGQISAEFRSRVCFRNAFPYWRVQDIPWQNMFYLMKQLFICLWNS
jgi:hypothetical protein